MAVLLEARALHAQYGWTKVLHGVDFAVEEGGITTILGANGAGKTTTLRAVCGMVRTSGEVRFDGRNIAGRATEAIVRLGIAHVPEGRGTFVNLTVEENLRLGAYGRSGQAGIAGSAVIGRQVVIGGSVGVADHVTIEDGVRVAGKGGVTSSLSRGDYAGYPAAPEACLVNVYSETARMGLHRDEDEKTFDAPVVSISLGADCLFRVGGQKRGDPTRSFRIRSGDVAVLGGESRLAYHGVDRIYPGTSPLDLPEGARINLTLRRVTAPGEAG